MMFLHFFTSCFQNLIFCEILWLTSRKKIHVRKRLIFIYRKNQDYRVISGSLEAFLLCEKMQIIFVCLTFTLSFRKGIMKDVVKQTIWLLACWFFKRDIWTCCEKLWVNVIFLWIAAVFHSFLFFLTFLLWVCIFKNSQVSFK